MRKTKIVCTIGPSTNSFEKIVELLRAGMNVARLNMSHGDLTSHQETLNLVKRAREYMKLPCAIMVDTCGPELRIGTFKDHRVELKKGDKFIFTIDDVVGDSGVVSCQYPALLKVLKVNQKIYANNGLLEFVVKEITKREFVCRVSVGGILSDHKSISIPHIRLPLPYVSEKDDKNIEFAAKNDAEYISASFVSSKSDLDALKRTIKKYGGRQEIIAKIESLEGINNLDTIIDACDGIMVARGDMGTEIAIEQIPAVQKNMIAHCIAHAKKVIVATEMLESMTTQRRPTRAETTDVAQAIYDKSGATMLSGETASGNYPIESCDTMAKIALATEKMINYDDDFLCNYTSVNKSLSAIAYSACASSRAIGAKAILCFSDKGKTADAISRFRPKADIVAVTHDSYTFNKLALTWGVTPVLKSEQKTLEEMLALASAVAKNLKLAKSGDKIIVTLGLPIALKGTTNAIHILNVE